MGLIGGCIVSMGGKAAESSLWAVGVQGIGLISGKVGSMSGKSMSG